ncbi:hypothetical protein QBC38DRAFT_373090, partial [Podospora fimiseda]
IAIIPHIPGLVASVVVDGEEAKEYQPSDNDDEQPKSLDDFDSVYNHQGLIPHVICYIEVKADAPFLYRVVLNPNFTFKSHHVAYRVQNDSLTSGSRHIFDKPDRRDQPIIKETERHTVGNTKEGYKRLYFRFAPLSVVESDGLTSTDVQQQMEAAKQCGTLWVKLFRMDEGTIVKRKDDGSGTNYLDTPVEFCEKALKGRAVDCVASFTATKPVAIRKKVHNCKRTDSRKRPFAVFEFRYRSKEGLMAEGIIPRPAENNPIVKAERSTLEQVQQMNDEEVRHRLAELIDQNAAAAQNGRRAVKREASPVDEVKSSTRYKTRKLNNGKVEIDLTDD